MKQLPPIQAANSAAQNLNNGDTPLANDEGNANNPDAAAPGANPIPTANESWPIQFHGNVPAATEGPDKLVAKFAQKNRLNVQPSHITWAGVESDLALPILKTSKTNDIAQALSTYTQKRCQTIDSKFNLDGTDIKLLYCVNPNGLELDSAADFNTVWYQTFHSQTQYIDNNVEFIEMYLSFAPSADKSARIYKIRHDHATVSEFHNIYVGDGEDDHISFKIYDITPISWLNTQAYHLRIVSDVATSKEVMEHGTLDNNTRQIHSYIFAGNKFRPVADWVEISVSQTERYDEEPIKEVTTTCQSAILNGKNLSISKDACHSTSAPTAQNEVPIVPPTTAGNVQIPALIPEPVVTMVPEERLIFKKSINNKRGALEHLIFHDTLLNTPCYIAVHNYNIKAQDENRYCIPFSGNAKEITHPMALTQTAKQYENYAYCAPIIKPEKRNIPGLAGFFKAFNPTYYNSHLARFIDDPFQIHKPSRLEGSQTEGTQISYVSNDPTGRCEGGVLSNPFITIHEYQKYQLTPGTVFLTASADKGEKVLHQYWQILSGQPEPACECISEVAIDGAELIGCNFLDDPIVQVKDLDSKSTYQVLMPQILAGMPARDHYCQAVNNAWLNEARAGNWARVDNNSPLMKSR